MTKKETVGKVGQELYFKDPLPDHTVHEQMEEQLSEYEFNVLVCIYGEDRMHGTTFDKCPHKHGFEANKHVPDATQLYGSDFYVVVETKNEPKMPNVMRNMFFHRKSCPTPQYDNAVYRYNFSKDDLELIWVLPNRHAYQMLKENFLSLTPPQKELLQYVLQDCDGTLLNKCKMLNGEI